VARVWRRESPFGAIGRFARKSGVGKSLQDRRRYWWPRAD
jgi:hypothetical protein